MLQYLIPIRFTYINGPNAQILQLLVLIGEHTPQLGRVPSIHFVGQQINSDSVGGNKKKNNTKIKSS